MALARYIDRVITEHSKEQRFDGYWHPGEGHEAAPIGCTAALRDDDYLAYHFRGSAWALGKGMPLDPVVGDIFGRVTGSTGGKGAGSPKWADPAIGLLGEGGTLGSAFVIAGGAALAADIRGTDQVAVAAFGDATSARGTFHETLIQAAVWNLPLIYFCENNHWQVATPFEAWSPTKTIAERGSAYGVPGVEVDGQDAVAVHEAMSEAVARARAGGGPTIVEAHVTRVRGHYEGDLHRADQSTYRDPLDVLAARVEGADSIIAQAELEVRAAYERALKADVADADILWKDVYA
ncbi:thiamine pyrophosphate-dependent dehydrogenase E1 component subunit alpha [Arthrobacter sp. BHU FT2]|nr:thiamine pyrophosphate-dependent dehydrogenase E1 component subunit alpha [Arthrobacter sp. BHU FT2]